MKRGYKDSCNQNIDSVPKEKRLKNITLFLRKCLACITTWLLVTQVIFLYHERMSHKHLNISQQTKQTGDSYLII